LEALVDKVPIDGLSGLTDEQNLGFSYETLDKYLRTGVCEDAEIKALIDRKRKMNKFKLELMPAFEYDAPILADDESSR
ncbi:MAG: NAD(+) synthase, partial [[Eubacterium] sulci]|nr:NAD(+) synthase [[Eubacterium] sulci]